jgi:hypothetical protein
MDMVNSVGPGPILSPRHGAVLAVDGTNATSSEARGGQAPQPRGAPKAQGLTDAPFAEAAYGTPSMAPDPTTGDGSSADFYTVGEYAMQRRQGVRSGARLCPAFSQRPLSPLATMGVRLRVGHQTAARAPGTSVLPV